MEYEEFGFDLRLKHTPYTNMLENKINELRIALYKKYNRIQLSYTLKCSETHISRILNNKSEMSLKQYFILKELIK